MLKRRGGSILERLSLVKLYLIDLCWHSSCLEFKVLIKYFKVKKSSVVVAIELEKTLESPENKIVK